MLQSDTVLYGDDNRVRFHIPLAVPNGIDNFRLLSLSLGIYTTLDLSIFRFFDNILQCCMTGTNGYVRNEQMA